MVVEEFEDDLADDSNGEKRMERAGEESSKEKESGGKQSRGHQAPEEQKPRPMRVGMPPMLPGFPPAFPSVEPAFFGICFQCGQMGHMGLSKEGVSSTHVSCIHVCELIG